MKKTLPIILVVIIIVGAGSFFGGIKYGQSKVTNGFPGGNFSGEMPTGGFGNGTSTRDRVNAGEMVSGEIISSDSGSITVELQSGGSKIVFYSGSTEISKSVSGTASDLSAGKTVMVSGTTNQDGSVTAKSIQLRPAIQNQP